MKLWGVGETIYMRALKRVEEDKDMKGKSL